MTPGPIVRSVSGTWHRMAMVMTLTNEAVTGCRRLVKVGKMAWAWDGQEWPGVRICTECRWHG
jgi:hypothetical protein